MPSTPAGFSGTGDFGSLHSSSSSNFRIFLRVSICSCTCLQCMAPAIPGKSPPSQENPSSSFSHVAMCAQQGVRGEGESCCFKALGSRGETELRRGENQLGKLVAYPLPCRSTFFFCFPAGKMKQTGNSWPPPLQMFGCDGNLSPGITGIKPQEVVSSELSSGSTSLPGLLLSCLTHPRPTWPDFGEEEPQGEQIKPVMLTLRIPALSGAYRLKFCSYSSLLWRGIGQDSCIQSFQSCSGAVEKQELGCRAALCRNLGGKITRQSIFLPGASLIPGKLKG